MDRRKMAEVVEKIVKEQNRKIREAVGRKK